MGKIIGIVMGESIDTIESTLKGILVGEIIKLVFNVLVLILVLIALSFVVKHTRTMIAQKAAGCVTGINQNNKTKEQLAQGMALTQLSMN